SRSSTAMSVLRDLASLDDDVLVTLHFNLSALDSDVAILLEDHLGAAALQGQFVLGDDLYLLRLKRVFLGDGVLVLTLDGLGEIFLDLQVAILADGLREVIPNIEPHVL